MKIVYNYKYSCKFIASIKSLEPNSKPVLTLFYQYYFSNYLQDNYPYNKTRYFIIYTK